MDWGLFEKGSQYKYLRSVLTFPPMVYFFALFTNILLRLTWIINAVNHIYAYSIDSRLLAFVIGLAEVMRRFQWNNIRMENEHVNNCGLFRATKEIPLPYGVDSIGKELDPGVVSMFTIGGDKEE